MVDARGVLEGGWDGGEGGGKGSGVDHSIEPTMEDIFLGGCLKFREREGSAAKN